IGEPLRPVLAREDEVRSGHQVRTGETLNRRPGTRLKPLPLLPSGPGGFTTRRRPAPGSAPRRKRDGYHEPHTPGEAEREQELTARSTARNAPAAANRRNQLAESEGFEPPIPLRVLLISNQVPSAARPALRIFARRSSTALAERVGFEPTIRCRIHAFQACAFGLSATSPKPSAPRAEEVAQEGAA